MVKKKFEQGGYSAIGNVFKRDAAIASKEPKVAPPAEKTEVPTQPVGEGVGSSTQTPAAPEPVVELKPAAAPKPVESGSTPKAEAPLAKASAAKRAPKKEAAKSAPRSTREGGRLPAIRIECIDDEFADFNAMVFGLGRAAGHKLSNNIIGRALVRIALEQEDEIRKAVEKSPPRARPANGNAEELALHEDEWQQAIREALRAIPNRRSR